MNKDLLSVTEWEEKDTQETTKEKGSRYFDILTDFKF